MTKPAKVEIQELETPEKNWVACHDALVCMGAKQIQKWCVRERDENGALIAVMLTKEVAHILAAAPQALAACNLWQSFFDEMPKGQFGKISCDIGLMNDAFIENRKALRKVRS